MPIKLKTKKLVECAKLPAYSREGDAAQDISSTHCVNIFSGETVVLHTGLAFEVPEGYVMHVYGRSGLAKIGLMVTNGVGVIDSNYRGEVKVLMTNTSNRVIRIESGDRIAQIALDKVTSFDCGEVDILSESNRGTAGFGSSGK